MALGTNVTITLRGLIRRPGFGAVATFALATGVAAATLVFSLVEGIVLRTQPLPDMSRLYQVHGTNTDWRDGEAEPFRNSWDDARISMEMRDAMADAPGVESLTAFQPNSTTLEMPGLPLERSEGVRFAGPFLETLGVQPVLGRWPSPDETAAYAPVVVIRETLWSTHFQRDPGVLGRTLTLDGTVYTIIGVAPGWLAVPGESGEWWTPFQDSWAEHRAVTALSSIVRAAPGRVAAVEDAMNRAVDRLASSDPAYAPMGVRLSPLREELLGTVGEGVKMAFAAVALLLLIGVVNLVNLVVAHTARRRSELAVRSALGAGRAGLVAPILGEVGVVSVLGGVLGVALAIVALDPLLAFLGESVPGFPALTEISVNVRVLAFSLGVTMGAALLAGLVPALTAARRVPGAALGEGRRGTGSRSTRRTQRALLFVEAALVMVLLAGAGLLARSTVRFLTIDPGYDPTSIAYVSITLPRADFPEPSDVEAALLDVEARLRDALGVRRVSRSSGLPGFGGVGLSPVRAPGSAADAFSLVAASQVGEDYFAALAIPVLAGRSFAPTDGRDSEPVAILSESLARQLFGDDDPVGHHVVTAEGARAVGGTMEPVGDESTLRVVGVVGDVRQLSIAREPSPVLYRPFRQATARRPELIWDEREAGPASAEAVRRAVGGVPGVVVRGSGRHRDSMVRVMGAVNAKTALLVAIAGLAGLLAMTGIYGVVAHIVSDQLRDIGLRMALGARSRAETRRMIAQALAPTAAGALMGLVVALNLSGALESSVFEISTLDPASYAGTFALLVAAAGIAAWMPARRASRVDPVRVLNRD